MNTGYQNQIWKNTDTPPGIEDGSLIGRYWGVWALSIELCYRKHTDYMSKGNYYKILGISTAATPGEIKAAYRKLASKHHPDRNQDDKDATKIMQEINEAYEVLSDPEKKRFHDLYGADWESHFKWRKSEKSNGYKGEGLRGFDYHFTIKLSIKEAAKEHYRSFTVEGKNVFVKIPVGVEAYSYLTYFGLGGRGMNGGPNGNLIVNIAIAPEHGWRLVGKDIYATASIDLYIALLGGEIVVDTIAGKVKLKIPAETQNGKVMRLRRKGFPNYKDVGPRGDFYITLSVKLPTKLTVKDKQLFGQLARRRHKS